jgi:2-oxoglutarate dehydrogenase E2 component (dihydrolipoamide succinyltransferase)
MVAEHDLDVAQITGTGVGGRVSKQDVLRFLEQRPAHRASPPEQPPESPAIPVLAGADPPPDLPPDADLLPLTPQRRVIAEHMLHAVRTIPHVTTVMEVDLSRVLAHREQQQAAFAQQGVRLTLTAYLVQAAVSALAVVPSLNGRFTAAGIVQHRRKHIGVAVALSEGLIVPVIHAADEKNLLGLARAVGDLTARARNQRLRPDETQGGTFTITNHGVSGSLFATPIINQGQGGILGVGAVQKRPVVITQGGSDAIAIRPVCYCSLTFDHRLCDGATADAFLSACKRFLEAYG